MGVIMKLLVIKQLNIDSESIILNYLTTLQLIIYSVRLQQSNAPNRVNFLFIYNAIPYISIRETSDKIIHLKHFFTPNRTAILI